MWQRGPGEGFHAAKADAIAINSKLKCRRVDPVGYVVELDKKTIGRGVLSRDAWADAFFKLGGRYTKGKAVLPRGENGETT